MRDLVRLLLRPVFGAERRVAHDGALDLLAGGGVVAVGVAAAAPFADVVVAQA